VFERIYFSRANDADIHRERKALGAALVPSVLKAAGEPLENIFFSYIPNSSRIAFHGLLEELFGKVLTQRHRDTEIARTRSEAPASETLCDSEPLSLCVKSLPRFGEIAVKDAKFRTFIADAAARREFYKHVYDVTYGLVRPGRDTLVVLDDSIVRGNTMKNAILPMLDRLGPKRIVIASSAPPIRYPDCYGIDMSTLGELVAFRALVNLLGNEVEDLLTGLTRSSGLSGDAPQPSNPVNPVYPVKKNPLASLYARFTEEEHCAEIARLLTPPDIKAEVKVVYQTVAALHIACPGSSGDWYFTGDYPTPGGYKVLGKALKNYLDKNSERSY
jgi:amidophosphoribosyltransferase